MNELKVPKPLRAPPEPRPSDDLKDRMRSQQSDAARAAALNERAVAANQYGAQMDVQDEDADRYAADNDTWDRVKDNMTQADHDACLQAMQTAYQEVHAETDFLSAAYGHIATGDQQITNGDNAAGDMQKIYYYNLALGHYQTSETCTAQSASHHAPFEGAAGQAEAILENYG